MIKNINLIWHLVKYLQVVEHTHIHTQKKWKQKNSKKKKRKKERKKTPRRLAFQ